MRKKVSSITLIAGILSFIVPGVVDAQSPWPMFLKDLKHTGRSQYKGPQTNNVTWTYRIGEERVMGPHGGTVGLHDSPVVGLDGIIYVGSYLDGESKFLAMNPNGTLKWGVNISGTCEGIPAIGDDGGIYFVTSGGVNRNGLLYCVNTDGSIRWRGSTGLNNFYLVQTGLAIGHDVVIYLTDTVGGALKAVNQGGTLKWSYPLGARSWSSPAIANDGTIYVGQDDHVLFALNQDGSEKWSIILSDVASYYAYSPAIGEDGTIYFGDWDRFYAITPSGQIYWSVEFSATNSPAIGIDGTIYVGGCSKFIAIEPTGTIKWSLPIDGAVQSSAAIGNDGTIYFGANEVNPEYVDGPEYDDSHVYALNPDGSLKWKYKTGGFVVSSPVITSDGKLVISSWDGKLYAFAGGEEPPEEPFTFIHLTDAHIGVEGEEGWVKAGPFWLIKYWSALVRLTDAVDEMITDVHPKPEFILDTGDIAHTADRGKYELYNDALQRLKDCGIEVYPVPGNHDRYTTSPAWPWPGNSGDRELDIFGDFINLPNDTQSLEFSEQPESEFRLYNYTFEHNGILFVGLNSGGDAYDIDVPEFPDLTTLVDFRASGLRLEQWMALTDPGQIKPNASKIIFMHHPAINTDDRGVIDEDLRDNFINYCKICKVQLVLTGHTHEAHAFDKDKYDWENSLPAAVRDTMYVITPSAGKDKEGFEHGYRIIDVKDGWANPRPYKKTGKRLKFGVGLASPGNLHVYDSHGRRTGIVEGHYERNIPRSFYFDSYSITSPDGLETRNTPKTVILYDTSENYTYQVEGTEEENYGLGITSVSEGEEITFEATNIPTLPEAVHQYTINWDDLFAGEEGVILKIDNNGDGFFERMAIADNELSYDEFALQTETVVDFDPDTLNLKSKGKSVTVYIELPEDFDASEIDPFSLELNELIPPLPTPIEIGDYDSDGINDLMVKFDLQELIAVLEQGEQIIDLTGRLWDGRPIAGFDFIRVIH